LDEEYKKFLGACTPKQEKWFRAVWAWENRPGKRERFEYTMRVLRPLGQLLSGWPRGGRTKGGRPRMEDNPTAWTGMVAEVKRVEALRCQPHPLSLTRALHAAGLYEADYKRIVRRLKERKEWPPA